MPSKNLMERYRKDLDETKRRGGGGGWYQLIPGNNRARFLPPLDEEKAFYVRAGQHFGLGPEKKSSVYCPKICIGPKEDCPICEFVQTVKNKSKKARELEMAKDYACNVRMMAMVLDRKADDDDPKIFSYGPMIHRQILQMVTEEYPDLYDLERGNDVVIKRDGEGLETKYQCMPAKDSSDVDPDIMDKVFDLEDYIQVRIFTDKELERVLDGEDPMKIVKEKEDRRKDDGDERPRARSRERDDERPSQRRARDDDEAPRGRSRRDEPEDGPSRRESEERDRDEPRGRARRDEKEPEDDRRSRRDRDDGDERGSRRDRDPEPTRSRARDDDRDTPSRSRDKDREDDRPRSRARDEDGDAKASTRDRNDGKGKTRERDEYDDAAKTEMDRLKEKAGSKKR